MATGRQGNELVFLLCRRHLVAKNQIFPPSWEPGSAPSPDSAIVRNLKPTLIIKSCTEEKSLEMVHNASYLLDFRHV